MKLKFPARWTEEVPRVPSPEQDQDRISRAARALQWQSSGKGAAALQFRAKTNWSSWGEQITVILHPDKIQIESRCSFPLQCFDWGKNKANCRALAQAYEADIRTFAAPLLLLLARGAKLDTILTNLEGFAPQIRAAFEWIKAKAQCTTADLEKLATRLPDLRRRKEEAIREQNFPLAAELHGRERALFESVGVRPTSSEETIPSQIQRFAALLQQECPKRFT